MGAKDSTPEREVPRLDPETPHNQRMMNALDRQVRRGEASHEVARPKVMKGVGSDAGHVQETTHILDRWQPLRVQ